MTKINTITVVIVTSLRVGQITLDMLNKINRVNHYFFHTLKLYEWQERRVSNPRPSVLETDALPIELRSFIYNIGALVKLSNTLPQLCVYSIILETTPAPTVRPPSRIANRSPSFIAMGAINCTSIVMLSPGITISVPAGNTTCPVTSVVLK